MYGRIRAKFSFNAFFPNKLLGENELNVILLSAATRHSSLSGINVSSFRAVNSSEGLLKRNAFYLKTLDSRARYRFR